MRILYPRMARVQLFFGSDKQDYRQWFLAYESIVTLQYAANIKINYSKHLVRLS
jgi:hypothetical protein